MKPTKYIRKGHCIVDCEKVLNNEQGVVFDGSSREMLKKGGEGINCAKRESRRLQMELDGGLGRGSVRAV